VVKILLEPGDINVRNNFIFVELDRVFLEELPVHRISIFHRHKFYLIVWALLSVFFVKISNIFVFCRWIEKLALNNYLSLRIHISTNRSAWNMPEQLWKPWNQFCSCKILFSIQVYFNNAIFLFRLFSSKVHVRIILFFF